MATSHFFAPVAPSNANNPDSIITGYAPKLPRDAYRITFPKGEDRTKQSFKEECDINNIMARYVKTGVLEFAARHQPQYGDFTGYDFQTAQDTVAKGKTMFAELPAQIRERFENSPALSTRARRRSFSLTRSA